MKTNVDLTENRDFRKPMIVSIGMINTLTKSLGLKNLYPWDSDKHDNNDDNEVVLTGDKKQRNQKRRWNTYEIGLECERCGMDLSTKPWSGNWRMCFNCENTMNMVFIINNDLVMKYPRYVKSQ